MDSRRVRAAVVLVLAVIALGAAGAAISAEREGGSSTTGLGDGAKGGLGDYLNPGAGVDVTITPLFDAGWLALFLGLLAVGGMVYTIVKLFVTILARDWAELKRFLLETGGKLVVFVLFALALYLIIGLFTSGGGGGGSTGLIGGGESEGAGGTSSDTGIQLPGLIGVVVVAAVVLVLAMWTLRRRAQTDAPSPSIDLSDDDVGGGAVGSGGERASAAVPSRPADNEVYRAWLDLTDAAGASASRQTPGEVAAAAVDAGVDEETTREITTLFESVRYGTAEPGEELERRAQRARERLGGAA